MMIAALAATGMLGSGFKEASLWRAIEAGVDFIGCDAGSNDQGPFNLGSNQPFITGASYCRDLELLLLASRRVNIPLIIGSAGGAGTDAQVDDTARLVRKLARLHGLRFRMGLIYTGQPLGKVREWFRQGRIMPLYPSPPLAEEELNDVIRVVAQIGAEPFMHALSKGCEVIVAGRSCDTAIFASVPLRAGLDPGLVWHAAKILECGAATAEQRIPDCMVARIADDHFVVEPPNPELRCTPESVLAHTLYENPNPFQFEEPAGTLDVSRTRYEPVSRRAVKVSGSVFKPAPNYTVKLEGVRHCGFRAIVLGGIRDPFVLRQLHSYVSRSMQKVHSQVEAMYKGKVALEDYHIRLKIYGLPDQVQGVETDGHLEIGILLDIIAKTQDLAKEIAQAARLLFLHNSIPEWTGHITNLALPFGLTDIEGGPVYEFALNHVVALEDPLAVVHLKVAQVG